MDYLRQAIREVQIKYQVDSPLRYFRHLFFVNGNGINFINGNPVKSVDFCRKIEYKDYYKSQLTFDEMKEYYFERLSENDFNNILKNLKFLNNNEKHEDELYEMAEKKLISQFEDLILIDSISDEELTDKEYWKKEINKSEYITYLMLSENYYKLEKLNENTEISLLKIGFAISKAYYDIFKKNINEKKVYIDKKNPFGKSDHDFFEINKKDIILLEKDIKRIEGYLK